MKVKFILEQGKLDIDNDVLEVDGIILKQEEYIISSGYDIQDKPISVGKVYKENGLLMCECELPYEETLKYPNIGYERILYHRNEHGGTNITESKLIYVGLSVNQNLDTTLPTINEQINKQ